ncbi:MAG: peroxiredoxin family protein [Gemmatimonadaceae bacterium]|nr:peroxiredoxin family protein [Gemmatimonadaceae bacterium]
MADFQQHKAELDELGMRVIALSSGSSDDARKTVEKLGLGFPVLHSLDARATSRTIGCYTGVHEGVPHVQPASFVLDHDGKIVLATYSTGKVGRLDGVDAVILAKDIAKKRATAGP